MKNTAQRRRLFEFYNEAGEKYPSEIAYKDSSAICRERFLIKLLKKSGGLTLDVGCADGHYKPYIEDYVGFDISISRLEKLEGRKTWAVAEYFPFKTGVFDRVFMSEVLEHTWLRDQILGECYRVLKRGGQLIMSTPYGTNPFHIQKNWSNLKKHGVKYNPYVHGHFSEEYTRKLLLNADLDIKSMHKIVYKKKPRFIITESMKNG